jgi:hypothetical protein
MQRIWDVIVALSLITDKKNALPIELIGKVSAVYCLITSGRNGKKCLLIEKRLSPSVERRTKTKKLTGDNPQNYKEMKLKDIVSQLANRINQPHVIECYLRKVYAKGYENGRKESPWHEVSEEPKNLTSWFATSNIRKDFEDYNVIRWAYVSDLIKTIRYE